MSNVEKFDAKKAKQAISEKTKNLEKNLLSARNDFELCKVLQEATNIVEAEILHNCALIDSMPEQLELEEVKILEEIENHVKGLEELANKFKDSMRVRWASAKNIERVMINTKQLNEVVLVDFE